MRIRTVIGSFALIGATLFGARMDAKVPLFDAAKGMERFSSVPTKWRQMHGASEKPVPQPLRNAGPKRVVHAADNGNPMDVYGYITMSADWDFVPQWVQLTDEGYNVKWDDQDYWLQGEVKLDIGWVRQGKLCGYATKLFMGQMLLGYYYKEFDIESGISTLTQEMDYENVNLFMCAAYSPDNDILFGFGVTADGEAALMKAPGANPTDIEVVRILSDGGNIGVLQSICWNDAEKSFVGINYSGAAVAIDLDGSTRMLAERVDVHTYVPYYTGLCYDATNRKYYWNVTDEYTSAIYALDSETFVGEEMLYFENAEIFSALYCPSKVVATDAPMRPEVKSVNFVDDALSGNVEISLPSSLENGEEISGQLEWTAMLDGAQYSHGSAQPGAMVSVPFESLSEGMHAFSFMVSYGGFDSADVSASAYIGKDNPSMPQNVIFSTECVSWDAVTTGQHQGYVNPSAITYEVFVDGEIIGSTSGTSLEVNLDNSGAIRTHQATVIAIFDGHRSEPGVSNKVAYGEALSLPLSIRPTEEEFLLMTTLDANGDGYGWHYVGDVTDPDFPCLDSDYSHSQTEPADDWLFLPPVMLDNTESFYNFTLWAKGRMTQLQPDEYFEVCIGKEPLPEAMITVLIPRTKCQKGFYDYEKYFSVDEPGAYYIGVHAVSDAAMFGVRIRDLYLYESKVRPESPNVVTSISATPAEGGELFADVKFTMPLINVENEAYSAETQLRVVVVGDTEAEVTGAPGEQVSVRVRTLQGDNRLRITPYCGDAIGLPSEVTVYTGVDVPTAPPALNNTVGEDNLTMHLTWSVPTEGEHKGYLDPEKIAYQIHTYNNMFGWIPIAELAEGVTEYSFVADDIDDGLVYVRLGVSASNLAGGSKYLTATGGVLGVPYNIPFIEGFDEDYGAECGPWVSVGGSGVSWGFAALSEISDAWADQLGGALVGMPSSSNVYSTVAFPKFNTIVGEGSAAIFKLRVWSGAGAPKSMKLYGLAAGMTEPVLVGTISSSKGWSELSWQLPDELQNRKWVQMQLRADFATKSQLCVVDRFEVEVGSGIENVNAETASYFSRNADGVVAVGLTGEKAEIFTLDGKRVATVEITSQRQQIRLSKGFYIVKTAGKSIKVSI